MVSPGDSKQSAEASLDRLTEVLTWLDSEPDSSDRWGRLDAVAKRFEVAFEYVWKALQAASEWEGTGRPLVRGPLFKRPRSMAGSKMSSSGRNSSMRAIVVYTITLDFHLKNTPRWPAILSPPPGNVSSHCRFHRVIPDLRRCFFRLSTMRRRWPGRWCAWATLSRLALQSTYTPKTAETP